ncbi:MAG: hypothetical protein AB7D51_07150 [Desulfovibrionaceae bacterium]
MSASNTDLSHGPEDDLKARAWAALAPLVPRLLTQLERDPDSPNFGSFDRDFWHYKMRDFSSAILQQGALSVHALAGLKLPGNPLFGNPRALEWARAGVSFLLARQLPGGGFEEYYPFESGYPPAAFGLYAAGLLLRGRGWPELSSQQAARVQKGCGWLLANPETRALNQEAAGLAALALCLRVPGVQVDAALLEARLEAFFDSQSEEGWFPEYGGPDLGYLCVTVDCLWDYYELSGDARAMRAMERAVGYVAAMLGPGGRTPVMINSRNTDYLVPYGLARLGAANPLASACARAIFERIAEADHFLHATDDRYLCHYVGQSFFRSLAHLDDLCEPAPLPCEAGDEFFFPEAGQYVLHRGGESLYFAGRKGGVVALLGASGVIDADFGWRVPLGKKIGVTHWQPDNPALGWEMALLKESETTVSTTGRLHAQGFAASTPLRHMALRVLSWLFGNKLIPFLKNKLIFRAASLPVTFTRELRIGPGGMILSDAFSCLPEGARPEPAPHASLRHVASAARMSPEELLPAPEFVVSAGPGGFAASRRLGQAPALQSPGDGDSLRASHQPPASPDKDTA